MCCDLAETCFFIESAFAAKQFIVIILAPYLNGFSSQIYLLSISQNNLHFHLECFAQSNVAIFSASVDEFAIIVCFLVLQITVESMKAIVKLDV